LSPSPSIAGNVNGAGNINANSNSTSNIAGNTSATTSPAAPSGDTVPNQDWWKYLIIGAIILIAIYQTAQYVLAPRPTFVPSFDQGDARVGAGKPLAFDFRMDLDPNVDSGDVKINSESRDFIKNERTSDD